MMNPPMGPNNGAPEAMPETPQAQTFVNVEPPLDEQAQIVKQCNAWKRSVKENAQDKKRIMRDCYAYSKGKFIGDDLLPMPSTNGNDKDIKSDRPQIFLPKTRQLVKTLYSYVKLTLLPSDDNYLRVKGRTAEAAMYEDELTEGLLHIFKQALITEKVGAFLLDITQMGNGAMFPCIKDSMIWEWQYDPYQQKYHPNQIDTPPLPDLERLDPLHFYIDPNSKDPETSKWGYFGIKKKQEIQDSPLYFNKEKLTKLQTKTTNKSKDSNISVTGLNDLKNSFTDTEESLDYDFYYFPYLKTETAEYRNMLVGVAGEQELIRFHPNLFPRGMNPVVFQDWMPDPSSPYGIGPAEDVKDIQKNINIMINYVVEWMARNGNRWVIGEDVDLTQAFGLGANIIRAKDPNNDFKEISGDYSEPASIMNLIGTLAADMQVVAGSQNPFQGSSNVDFKKTATELQILQENSISVIREVIEHIAIGVKRIFDRLMYLTADLYKEPIEIRVDDPVLGTRYINVDFRLLKSGLFEIELTNINPSQSKQAQVQSLMQLLELIGSNPQAFLVGEPIIQEIGKLQGLKKVDTYLEQVKQRMGMMMNASQPQLPGVPGPEVGSQPPIQSGMEGPPPPPPGIPG